MALVANYDKLNFDFVKRWFSYRSLARSDSGQAESFPFDGDSDSIFASVGGDLLVCSPNSLQLYSGSGQLYVNETISMENPAVDTAGETALIYDVGGEELLIYASREEAFSLTQETGQSILSASLNRNGWLAVVSQQSGFKGAVTIYDSDYATPLIQISRSDRFIMDAVVSPDNRSVAVLTMGLTDGSFESRVECYALARMEEDTEPDWSCPVRGATRILGPCAGTDRRHMGAGGHRPGSSSPPTVPCPAPSDYGGRYLKAFSLDGRAPPPCVLGEVAGRAARRSWFWWAPTAPPRPRWTSMNRSSPSPPPGGMWGCSPPTGWTCTTSPWRATAPWTAPRAPKACCCGTTAAPCSSPATPPTSMSRSKSGGISLWLF